MKTNIFVYGTLRQQFGNHHFLSTARFLGDAITQSKYVMHASSSIPFVSQSQAVSQIVGEVYEVDAQTLANLDRLEGCRVMAEEPLQFDANSWYTREQVSVRWADGGECLTVWMYFNEHETRHAIIPTGDFKDLARFLNPTDRVWYFAYGSNMDVARMLKRDAPFTRRIKGRVSDHRLVFNKIADDYPGFGFANIIPEQGYDVMGVLYELNEAGLTALDVPEGVTGGHYFRCQMTVLMDDGTSVVATVYLAHPNKVEDGLLPTGSYMGHLYRGLDILGEGGKSYLDQSLLEARVTDDERFLTAQDIPTPSHDDYLVDVRNHALPVLLNGQKVKMYFYNGTWSERIVFHCEPEVAPYFEAMDLRVDELGFFGTKRFNFLRRGILELGHQRLVVERDR